MAFFNTVVRTLLCITIVSVMYYSVVVRPRLEKRTRSSTLRLMLDMENQVSVSRKQHNSTPPPLEKVCVLAPVTSRKQGWKSIGDTCLLRILLPSVERTCEPGVFKYTVYVGYDTSDMFFNNHDTIKTLEKHTAANYKQFNTKFLAFDNPLQKPGPVMNGISKAAYDDGCDFLYRVNDDSELVTPWASKFASTLREFKPPLVGVVGPTCREGNTRILIQDFVHKKHHEIFGRHYPPVLTDWWLDDWVSLVYGESNTVKRADVLVVHHIDATRYTVTRANEKKLISEVNADKKVLERYLRGSESAATSGKLFQMHRKKKEVVSKHQHTKPLVEKTQYPRGSLWAVITTIFEPTQLIRTLAAASKWCTVVVADRKSLNESDYLAKLGIQTPPCFVYLTVEKQLKLDYNIVPLTKMDSFGRKNVGYVFAIHHGAEQIYDTDDDNEIHNIQILEKWAESSAKIPQWVVTGSNPYPAFGVQNIWPRGLPLNHIKDLDTYTSTPVESNYHLQSEICIIQSLANEEPDVDAIYRLTNPNYPVSFNNNPQASYVREGTMAPFNAQATLWVHQHGFELMLLPTTVHGRVSDIWRGYIAQAIRKGNVCRLVFSFPWATQKRNSHNYLADFESELPLYTQTTALTEYLLRQEYSGMGSAMHDMHEHGIVDADDVKLARAWELDIKRALAVPRLTPRPKTNFRHLFISMGRSIQLLDWINKITSDPTLDHVDLILGSFDQSAPCPLPERVECYHISGTTWTTGRNTLVKKAYQREKRIGFTYDYWTITDSDIVVSCRTITGAALVTTPSGCFAEYDNYVQEVKGPIIIMHGGNFIDTNQNPDKAMFYQESFDAAWNTFHRNAIPLLMPYYPDLDPITWWSSQAIFWYRVQCFNPPFASAPLSMFYQNPDHHPYPKNPRNLEAEREVGIRNLHELAGNISLAPLDYPDQIRHEKIQPIASMANKSDWQKEPLFQKCKNIFSPRFTQWVESV